MLIDTPEKLEQLQQGQIVDQVYFQLHITSDAHPNVFHLPQHFRNTSLKFVIIKFYDVAGPANNSITLVGDVAKADFHAGKNLLSGISSKHTEYQVNYWGTAVPTVDNIDSILQWKSADTLRINGAGNVTLNLSERIDEFSELTKLKFLDLSIESASYKNIKPALFIQKVSSLSIVRFVGQDMTSAQMKEFKERNPAPAKWSVYQTAKSVDYVKTSA